MRGCAPRRVAALTPTRQVVRSKTNTSGRSHRPKLRSHHRNGMICPADLISGVRPTAPVRQANSNLTWPSDRSHRTLLSSRHTASTSSGRADPVGGRPLGAPPAAPACGIRGRLDRRTTHVAMSATSCPARPAARHGHHRTYRMSASHHGHDHVRPDGHDSRAVSHPRLRPPSRPLGWPRRSRGGRPRQATWPPGHLATWPPGHLATWPPGHPATTAHTA
jgi:hypothetical protein